MLTDAKATRATRPLIEYPASFERDYCPECMLSHMVEKTRAGKIICHGQEYYFDALKNRTHYARRLGKGFELVPMTRPEQATALTLDWQIAQEERESIDMDQDW